MGIRQHSTLLFGPRAEANVRPLECRFVPLPDTQHKYCSAGNSTEQDASTFKASTTSRPCVCLPAEQSNGRRQHPILFVIVTFTYLWRVGPLPDSNEVFQRAADGASFSRLTQHRHARFQVVSGLPVESDGRVSQRRLSFEFGRIASTPAARERCTAWLE